MYKFKANLRDRFSHQHPRSNQRESDHHHQQHSYLNDTASTVSSNSSNMSEENNYSSQKRRKIPSGDERSEIRMYTSKSNQQQMMHLHEQQNVSGRSHSPLKLLSLAASTVDLRQKQRNPHQQRTPHIPVTTTSVPRELTSELSESNILREVPPHQSGPNVPIFALHPKGSYYIPLSIDYTVIAPSMLVLTSAEESSGSGSVVLHPITINVNFCGPVQMRINPGIDSRVESAQGNRSSRHDNLDSRHHSDSGTSSRQDHAPRWRERLDRILSPSRDDHFGEPNNYPDQQASCHSSSKR